jgi:hypothetical protein
MAVIIMVDKKVSMIVLFVFIAEKIDIRIESWNVLLIVSVNI